MSLRRAAFVFTRLLFATSSSPSIIISGSGSSSGCAAALSISSRFPAPPPVMEPGTLPPLVLASKSPTRQLILREMGFSFLCIPADIDEKAIGDRLRDKPEELVLEIGRAKAAKVLAELEKQQQQQQQEEGGVGGGQQGQGQSPLPPLPLELLPTSYMHIQIPSLPTPEEELTEEPKRAQKTPKQPTYTHLYIYSYV